MDIIKARCEESRIAFLQSTQAVLQTTRSVFELRAALVASADRISKSKERLNGCARNRHSRMVITNPDAVVARLSEMTSPAVAATEEGDSETQQAATA